MVSGNVVKKAYWHSPSSCENIRQFTLPLNPFHTHPISHIPIYPYADIRQCVMSSSSCVSLVCLVCYTADLNLSRRNSYVDCGSAGAAAGGLMLTSSEFLFLFILLKPCITLVISRVQGRYETGHRTRFSTQQEYFQSHLCMYSKVSKGHTHDINHVY